MEDTAEKTSLTAQGTTQCHMALCFTISNWPLEIPVLIRKNGLDDDDRAYLMGILDLVEGSALCAKPGYEEMAKRTREAVKQCMRGSLEVHIGRGA